MFNFYRFSGFIYYDLKMILGGIKNKKARKSLDIRAFSSI
jgi:hypothetical protein